MAEGESPSIVPEAPSASASSVAAPVSASSAFGPASAPGASGPVSGSGATAELPLFDEKYRWVLLHALRWLRDVPRVDLDDPEQLEASYGFLSAFVQQYVQRRGLLAKLDAMKVAAVAESASARSTVEDILINWLSSK